MNAAPFDFERAYDAFGIYARLEHGGDIQAATRELAKQGFGSQNRMQATRRHSEMKQEIDALDEVSGWPMPEPIASGLPPVEDFDETLLPQAFRGFVVDIAERMQVPMDYPAAVVVVCLSGVVSRRARVQPKGLDSGWIVVQNLWGGIVAPPGFMKSPVEESELRRSAWREQFKSSAKRGKAAPNRIDDKPTMPTLRRLIVNDATFEALHQTMSENPAGILVVRDELTGWWSQLDRAGREGERAFCLQSWNGGHGAYDRPDWARNNSC